MGKTCGSLRIGAGIILTDISNKELGHDSLKTKYPNSSIIIHKMDVTDEANIRAVNEELNHKKVNLDILINNAAIDPKAEDLTIIKHLDWSISL